MKRLLLGWIFERRFTLWDVFFAVGLTTLLARTGAEALLLVIPWAIVGMVGEGAEREGAK